MRAIRHALLLLLAMASLASPKRVPVDMSAIEWTECTALCGGGARHIVDQPGRTMACNSLPCNIEAPEGCQCGGADIMFIIDRSKSIKILNYWRIKQFVLDLITGYDNILPVGVNRDSVRFAIVTFDKYSQAEFDFNAGYSLGNIDDLMTKVWEMIYDPTNRVGTNTPGGLHTALEVLDEQGRPESPQVIVIITDGKPTVTTNLDEYIAEVNSLDRSVFALGIGRVVQEEVYNLVMGDSSRAFLIDKFEELPGIVIKILDGFCCNSVKVCSDSLIGECSAPCGPGEQTLRTTCEMKDKDGNVVSEESFDNPQSCSNGPCEEETVCSDTLVGECSDPCGPGEQTIRTTCEVKDVFGNVISTESFESTQNCSIGPCEEECSDTLVGECSAPCGPGEQTLRTTCEIKDKDGNVVSEESFDNTQSCSNGPCEEETVCSDTLVGECSVPCGPGEQTIRTTCEVKDVDGNVISTESFEKTQDCSSGPCEEETTKKPCEDGEECTEPKGKTRSRSRSKSRSKSKSKSSSKTTPESSSMSTPKSDCDTPELESFPVENISWLRLLMLQLSYGVEPSKNDCEHC